MCQMQELFQRVRVNDNRWNCKRVSTVGGVELIVECDGWVEVDCA